MILFIILVIIYAVIINIYAVFITVHDKHQAQKHKYRVPEATLFATAALSGCIAMYITMRVIHHKTKHKRFMIGIPIIFILECAAGIGIWYMIDTGILYSDMLLKI